MFRILHVRDAVVRTRAPLVKDEVFFNLSDMEEHAV